jgi:uncharacterized coiled-coil DUF342 family protein
LKGEVFTPEENILREELERKKEELRKKEEQIMLLTQELEHNSSALNQKIEDLNQIIRSKNEKISEFEISRSEEGLLDKYNKSKEVIEMLSQENANLRAEIVRLGLPRDARDPHEVEIRKLRDVISALLEENNTLKNGAQEPFRSR